jgi:predicted outer membrane protein
MSVSLTRTTLSIFIIVIVACNHESGNKEAEQVRQFADDPKLVNDKLFVLVENNGAIRERTIATLVLEKTTDPQVKEIAQFVKDGHQAGIDRLKEIAAELKMVLPLKPTGLDVATVEVLKSLTQQDLTNYFLIRQRAQHAWDLTLFTDYSGKAVNEKLRKYIRETIAPLREHAQQIVAISNAKGISGGLSTEKDPAQ